MKRTIKLARYEILTLNMFDNSEKCVFLQRIKYLILNNMKKERYLEDDFNGFVEELINLSRLEVKEEGISKRMLAK